MKSYIGSLVVLLFCIPAFSAVSKNEVKKEVKKANKPAVAQFLNTRGSMHGGAAGSGFTLLDVRRTANAKRKIERVVIDIGDRNGKPLAGKPGFYFAEFQKKQNRVILDFSQMPSARVDQKKLANIFKSSKAVRASRMSLDPVDNALNLSLDLKKNTKVKVYSVPGKKTTSKVVLDFITE